MATANAVLQMHPPMRQSGRACSEVVKLFQVTN